MFSCDFCFHFSWRLKSFVCAEKRVVSILVWWLSGFSSLLVSMASRFEWSLADYAVSKSPVLFLVVVVQWSLELVAKGVGLDFRVRVMIIISWRGWMSIFGVCELQPQTGHSIQPPYSRVPERKFLVQKVRRPKLFQLVFVLRSFSFLVY